MSGVAFRIIRIAQHVVFREISLKNFYVFQREISVRKRSRFVDRNGADCRYAVKVIRAFDEYTFARRVAYCAEIAHRHGNGNGTRAGYCKEYHSFVQTFAHSVTARKSEQQSDKHGATYDHGYVVFNDARNDCFRFCFTFGGGFDELQNSGYGAVFVRACRAKFDRAVQVDGTRQHGVAFLDVCGHAFACERG